MRSLITGGNGFIAKHLAKVLDVVEAPDRNELDITDRDQVLKYFKENEFDYIFHLAAGATQDGHKGKFRDIFETNVVGTVNLLEGAGQQQYKAFINTGTSSEYGSQKTDGMYEGDCPDPEFYYSGTKAATTMICQALAREEGRPIVTVRPFSIYGPGESEKRFIPTVIRCAKTGDTLDLAKGVHDWTHVEDVVNGLVQIARKAHDLKGQIVNLGTGRQMTNEDVVKTISYCMDKGIKCERVQLMREWDKQTVWRNGSDKARDLGIEFRTFEEGIGTML